MSEWIGRPGIHSAAALVSAHSGAGTATVHRNFNASAVEVLYMYVALRKFPRSILGYAQYGRFNSIGESQARRSCSHLQHRRPLAHSSIWTWHSQSQGAESAVECRKCISVMPLGPSNNAFRICTALVVSSMISMAR